MDNLHQAAKELDPKRARQLIEGGVDFLSSLPECELNLKGRDGSTLVMWAAACGKKSVVDFLLQRGVQVDCADDRGCTLLHHVASRGWTDTAQVILDRGEADLNAATARFGSTPLIHAAEEGHEEVAALLIRAGADVNRSDTDKMTALHRAASRGRTRVVQVLLQEEGLELNPQDRDGETPLYKACYWGRREIVKQLLLAGADTTLKDNQGETALSEGIRNGELTLEDIRLFVQHRAFLQDCDYKQISKNPSFKDNVLKDVDICTQSIVNKYHRHSLPALRGKFAGILPSIDRFNLLPEHLQDVENFVKGDIQANTFCNVVQACPLVLRVMCVESLLAACQSAMKRSAASDSEKEIQFKKPRI